MSGRALAEDICTKLRAADHQAWLVGGCVRDLLLGREPKDYDVATDARPWRVQELFPESVAVGAQFGVILVVRGDDRVEVATFRSDIGYSGGRHPDRVTYSDSPQEDVRRRDFTINGLLLDPRDGAVLDCVGGQQDLRHGIVRAIGDPAQRFREDHLRMLRAVRFAARFHFHLEENTRAAILPLAGFILEVSRERVRDELTRILTEGAARRGFELLDETGLLAALLPGVAAMKGVEQPPEFHPEGDVWIHTRLMLEMLPPDCSPTLAWGVLLHDVGKPPTFSPPAGPGGRIRFDGHVEVGAQMTEELCRRFHFSNEDTDQIVALVANHLRFKDVERMRASTLKRFVRLPGFEEHLELHRLDCLGSHRSLTNYDFVRNFLATTPPIEVRPPRLLGGDDLVALGLKPGPIFRQLLYEVEEGQLEGRLATREDALGYVRDRLRNAIGDGKEG
jgi:poly(A) polymerase